MKTRTKSVVKTPNNLSLYPEPILKMKKRAPGNNAPLSLFDFDELEVARQLTLIEFDYFQKILVSEFILREN
jgi:hypothetical protein